MAQEALAAKQCDLCRGSEFALIGRSDRRGRELLTDVCTTCGLVSHHRIPDERALSEFYALDYRRQYHGEATPSARRVMRAWKNAERLQRQLAPWIPAGADLMEVGAGIGCTVRVFQDHGYAAHGIEPNQGFQAFAERLLHADVKSGYLVDLPPHPRHDCVLLVQVIEHLRSPRQALEHLHHTLKPEGLLYVECPNLGAPFATRARLFHFAHIYNFTRATLEMLGRACGFEAVHWFNGPHDADLQVLFRRSDTRTLEIDPQSLAITLEAIDRYNLLTYHLRGRYLGNRLRKLASYVEEHWLAERYVRRILGRAREPQWGKGANPISLTPPSRTSAGDSQAMASAAPH